MILSVDDSLSLVLFLSVSCTSSITQRGPYKLQRRQIHNRFLKPIGDTFISHLPSSRIDTALQIASRIYAFIARATSRRIELAACAPSPHE